MMWQKSGAVGSARVPSSVRGIGPKWFRRRGAASNSVTRIRQKNAPSGIGYTCSHGAGQSRTDNALCTAPIFCTFQYDRLSEGGNVTAVVDRVDFGGMSHAGLTFFLRFGDWSFGIAIFTTAVAHCAVRKDYLWLTCEPP